MTEIAEIAEMTEMTEMMEDSGTAAEASPVTEGDAIDVADASAHTWVPDAAPQIVASVGTVGAASREGAAGDPSAADNPRPTALRTIERHTPPQR